MTFDYKGITFVRTNGAIELQTSGAKDIHMYLPVATCLANAVRVSALTGGILVAVEDWLLAQAPVGRNQTWLFVNDERITINLKPDDFATVIDLMVNSPK